MNIKYIITVLFIALAHFAFAQPNNPDAEVLRTKKNFWTPKTTYKKPSKDYVMFQIGYHNWLLNTQADSIINLRKRGHDINLYFCYDFSLSKNNGISFAAGAGVASSNVYLSNQKISLKDTFLKFTPLDSNLNSRRYKLSSNYLEFPFELRFFGNPENRNRGLKIALSFKIGTLINFHTKNVYSSLGSVVKDKEISRKFHQSWRITPGVRIGWGNFTMYGNYQLSDVFKPGLDQGTGMTPYSIGFCLSGL